MVCAAELPLGPSTLVAGSTDGGRSVVAPTDPAVSEVLAAAARRLRLRPHPCRGVTVFSGAGAIDGSHTHTCGG